MMVAVVPPSPIGRSTLRPYEGGFCCGGRDAPWHVPKQPSAWLFLVSRRLLRALRLPFGLPFGREHFVVKQMEQMISHTEYTE